ncbi:hypothetical protein BaRGS_00021486, partial [Batillaria attramentaria]
AKPPQIEEAPVVCFGREQRSTGVPQVRGGRALQTAAGPYRTASSRHHARSGQPEPVRHH